MVGIFASIALAVVIAVPLIGVVRGDRKLTWTTAVLLGVWLTAIALILLGEVPSRILYWFDTEHATLAERFSLLGFFEDDLGGNLGYILVADIVANTVQGTFFVIMVALAYFWGERHRKSGRFRS
jgi:hypothetical protein